MPNFRPTSDIHRIFSYWDSETQRYPTKWWLAGVIICWSRESLRNSWIAIALWGCLRVFREAHSIPWFIKVPDLPHSNDNIWMCLKMGYITVYPVKSHGQQSHDHINSENDDYHWPWDLGYLPSQVPRSLWITSARSLRSRSREQWHRLMVYIDIYIYIYVFTYVYI